MRVLIAHNHHDSVPGLNQVFRQQGHVVENCPSAEEALNMLQHYDYDLFLAAAPLADMKSSDLMRRLRRARIEVPAMVLSAERDTGEKLNAFSAGADDYIDLPCCQEEITARAQALLRRARGFSEPLLRHGPLELNLETQLVTINGAPVHLTGKEYAILELLVMRKGAILTKDMFLNHLYGGIDEPEIKIIDVFICKLRRKLQKCGVENLITTIWGRGYIMRDDNTQGAFTPAKASKTLPA
ncbi:response regulator transcription factor [Formicincola oecophyllae]|uniref:Response regulator transcription factor n=1 Tax=Formicincola oecophyllae TaxID=2558361 RepID=A0A4Y6U8K6_9PROT|nr:response regulator transcription factor [Formicincola oecophyllae]QDH13783.1 response regulator transcription factor [Formicincola oecophyllae]